MTTITANEFTFKTSQLAEMLSPADRELQQYANAEGCTAPKGYYKPFRFPWAFEGYITQKRMDWTPDEVPLGEDVKDWKTKLSNGERNLLTQLFRFFTTGDVDVGQAYMDKYIPIFRNEEIRMMLSQFTAMESVHAHAYSLLLDTVGMPEIEYQAFKKYKEMADKHDYISSFDIHNEEDVALALAVFSAFTEGLQLFSTFAILMHFARGDLSTGARMKGMTQIVTWSIRDESLHVEYMSRLFRTYISERPYLNTPAFREKIYSICRKMIELEFAFIDLAFSECGGALERLTSDEVKQYMLHTADLRLMGIGLEPLYGTREEPIVNPLAYWLTPLLAGIEHANFFESRATEYAKAAMTGSWDDHVWATIPTTDEFVEPDFDNEEELDNVELILIDPEFEAEHDKFHFVQ